MRHCFGIVLQCLALAIATFAALTAALAFGQSHPLCAVDPNDAIRSGRQERDLCEVIDMRNDAGLPSFVRPRWDEAPDAAAVAISGSGLLILGEMHDNPVHHRLRAGLLLLLAAKGAHASLVFEHIRTDQHLALVGFRALDRARRRDPGALLSALQWDRSGWPAAAIFRPLFEAALDLDWPILPGHPTRNEVRAVAHSGLAALASDELERLGLSEPLPAPLHAALLSELAASHCGLLPAAASGGMVEAQRYRDAHMARALVDAAETHGRAVLLTGNGHARSDRGVPWHLRRARSDKRIVTILFLEVASGRVTAPDYVERDPDGNPIADFLVLTPAAERPDPCIEMRKTLGK